MNNELETVRELMVTAEFEYYSYLGICLEELCGAMKDLIQNIPACDRHSTPRLSVYGAGMSTA
jgi:hypothetical protein